LSSEEDALPAPPKKQGEYASSISIVCSFTSVIFVVLWCLGLPLLSKGCGCRHENRYLLGGCKEGYQTTPKLNAPAVFECQQLYMHTQCYGGSVHWMSDFTPIVLNGPAQIFFLIHFWHYCPLLLGFHRQHTFSVSETVAESFQADRHLFKHFWLTWWMYVLYILLWLHFGFNINKWKPGFIM
jgi:hypothetical protein